ncbi:uncharacterized protein V1518DRAFT_416691 [Limtongia smithiae]|uniref:uncharacterized protein n=1 Tax=Limtongia smithiae TaxID=1125753 RepID=UPI0034D0066C
MKFFAAIYAVVLLALATFVAAHLDERAYVTVTTIETITSCSSEYTQCTKTSTSVMALTTSTPVYTNATTTTIANSTSPAVATFTGAAANVKGSVFAAAAGVAGVLALVY